MNLFASILAALGFGAAGAASQASWAWILDEEECPKSLIK